MEMIAMLYDYLGYVLGGLLVLLCLIALIRVLMKAKRGESVHIEPQGVLRDLPDTVTGLGKIEEVQENYGDEEIK